MTETKKLVDKYIAAMQNVKNPELDSENPDFHNKYASLAATLQVIKDACKPEGIVYRQKLVKDAEGYVIVTSVMDGAESMELSTFPINVPENPQTLGSNLTYSKRQVAQIDWCIVGDEDDDAEAAIKAPAKKPEWYEKQTKQSKQEKKHGRYDKLNALINEAQQYGIAKDGIASYYEANFHKPLAESNDVELKQLEAYVAGLIGDAKELAHEKEIDDHAAAV